MRLSPGQNVGPYEILPALGLGGIGEVYNVAIKRCPPTNPATQTALPRHPRVSAVLARIGLPERY